MHLPAPDNIHLRIQRNPSELVPMLRWDTPNDAHLLWLTNLRAAGTHYNQQRNQQYLDPNQATRS